MEGVGGFVLSFAPVAGAGCSGGFEGRGAGSRAGRGGGLEGGEFSGRWGEEKDFLGLEGCEMEGRGERGFEDAELRGYHKLLILRGDGEVVMDGAGEVDDG